MPRAVKAFALFGRQGQTQVYERLRVLRIVRDGLTKKRLSFGVLPLTPKQGAEIIERLGILRVVVDRGFEFPFRPSKLPPAHECGSQLIVRWRETGVEFDRLLELTLLAWIIFEI